jgi:hypothetical protein
MRERCSSGSGVGLAGTDAAHEVPVDRRRVPLVDNGERRRVDDRGGDRFGIRGFSTS